MIGKASLIELSRTTKKNVVVTTMSSERVATRAILDLDDAIIIVINPHINPSKIPFQVSAGNNGMDSDRVPCLGRYIKDVIVPFKSGDSKNPLQQFDKIWCDTATNTTFAARKDDTVYVMVSFRKIEDYGQVFDRLAKRWQRPITRADRDEDAKTMQELAGRDRSAFMKFSSENANTYISDIQNKDRESIEEIGTLQALLAEHMKMHRQLTEILDRFNIEDFKRQIQDKAIAQFDAVMKMDKVRSMHVADDGRIIITTNSIYCKDPRTKKVHDLGKFLIELNLLTPKYDPKKSIKIKNLSYHVEAFGGMSMSAPHIYEDGHMCHGNLSEIVIGHYAERDVLALVEDVFAFMETVNVEDAAGKEIVKWPVVGEDAVAPTGKTVEHDATDDELVMALQQ